MEEVVGFFKLLILVLSCQGFDAIVEGGQESTPGVNDTKNDQKLPKSFNLVVNLKVPSNTRKYPFDPKIHEYYSTDSNTDIINSVETLLQTSEELQKKRLKTFSEEILNAYKTQTKEMLDVMMSINSTRCQQGGNFQAPFCYRGMNYEATERYNTVEVMRDTTLKRDILCDTLINGGGWIVIQRRIVGDVNFYRNWNAYKNGFGTPPGDFWLGNDAIHELTNKGAYELRIDFNNGTKDLFALYSSFKLESEANNYTLRLGSHSGTLGEDSTEWGLSYSNGLQFSTYDRDNDEKPNESCARIRYGAWWYKNCYKSNLNGLWGKVKRDWSGMAWVEGSLVHSAKATQMKIRRI